MGELTAPGNEQDTWAQVSDSSTLTHGSIRHVYGNIFNIVYFFQLAYCTIDMLHKSHNAPVPYPTMHHFEPEISYKMVHCGIFSYALWDLWDGFISFTMAVFENSLEFILAGRNINVLMLHIYTATSFNPKCWLHKCHSYQTMTYL